MPSLTKHRIDQTVYDAALERIHLLYDRFDTVMVSFSGGKDSTVALNLALQVATERGRLPLDTCFVDEEAITPETVEYVELVRSRDDIRLKWVCLPGKHRNACSRTQPYWYPWLEADKDKWVRPMPEWAITINDVPGFKLGMSQADITPLLYGPDLGTVAEIRGIRAQESIRRLQSVTKRQTDNWMTQNPIKGYFYPTSPIYDWTTEDVWVATQSFDDYNHTYDVLAIAGVPPSLQRCTPPYGEEPLQKLWTYKSCWPEMWAKMINRVDGAATAGRYALTDLYGTRPKEPPPGMTWKDWCYSLLELYPNETKRQIAANVAEIIKLHQSKTRRPIPEVESDPASGVSWKWLCQIINRGDLKGRKQGMLTNRALDACKKLGITPQEALNNALVD